VVPAGVSFWKLVQFMNFKRFLSRAVRFKIGATAVKTDAMSKKISRVSRKLTQEGAPFVDTLP
jgi:hypothetical protein